MADILLNKPLVSPSLLQRDEILERLIAKNEPLYQRSAAEVLMARLNEKLREMVGMPIPQRQTHPTLVSAMDIMADEVIRQWRLEAPQNGRPFFAGVFVTITVDGCNAQVVPSQAFLDLFNGAAKVQMYFPTQEEISLEFRRVNRCL